MKNIFIIAYFFIVSSVSGAHRHVVPRLDGRIVGGRTVDVSDYPYQVSLQYYGSHICGATHISAFYMVTACHCTDLAITSAISVRAGSSFHAFGGLIAPVEQFYRHPNYNTLNTDYDISVLRLSVGLSSGVGVSAIQLPYLNQEFPVGTSAVVTGWGYLYEGSGALSPRLQAVNVPTISVERCRELYSPSMSSEITERMLCAGFPQGGADACQGDSGGPMVIEGILVGLVSWGLGCARADFPGVYSNVAVLRPFITSITGF